MPAAVTIAATRFRTRWAVVFLAMAWACSVSRVQALSAPEYVLGGLPLGGNVTRVVVQGSRAYVAKGLGPAGINPSPGFHVVDITDPRKPVSLGSFRTNLAQVNGIAVVGTRAYLALGNSEPVGVCVLELTNAARPQVVGFRSSASSAYDVAVSQGRLYVGTGTSIEVLDAADPTLRRVGSWEGVYTVGRVVVSDGLVYGAGSGFQAFRPNDTGLELVAQVMPAFIDQIVVDRGQIVAVTAPESFPGRTEGELRGYSWKGPRQFQQDYRLAPFPGYGLALTNAELAVASGRSGLALVDLRQPSVPLRRGVYPTRGTAWDVALAGRLAAIADGDAGLTLVDLDRLPALPDLVVSQLEAPDVAVSGGTVSVGWTVDNLGGGLPERGWIDRLYLGPEPGIQATDWIVEFPFDQARPMEGAVPRVQRIQLPERLGPGEYWWKVVVDARSEIPEADEWNNELSGFAPMRIVDEPRPDLRVTDLVLPPNLRASETFRVSWVVTNAGPWSTPAVAWNDAVFLSSDEALDAQDHLLGRVARPRALDRGESYSAALDVALPRTVDGSWFFLVQVDADQRVGEGPGETDNVTASARVGIEGVPLPDLQVRGIELPQEIVSGSVVGLTWSVMNVGPGPTLEGNWSDQLLLQSANHPESPPIPLGAMVRVGSLAPGAAYEAKASVRVPLDLTGDYYVLVRADAGGEVVEFDDANNLGSSLAAAPIQPGPRPDLRPTHVVVPSTARAGDPLAITYVVGNVGAAAFDVGNWIDQVYLVAEPPVPGTVLPPAPVAGRLLAESWRASVPPPGDAVTNRWVVELPETVEGAWHLLIVVNGRGELPEADLANNMAASPEAIRIVSRPPDLVLASASAPDRAQAGGALPVTWTVANRGSGETRGSRWSDRWVLSRDIVVGNADDVVLADVPHAGVLHEGNQYSVTSHLLGVPYTVTAGNWRLFVVADGAGEVFEGPGEGNNAALVGPISLTRSVPDLRVAEVRMDSLPADAPDVERPVLAGTRIRVSWRVDNLGSGTPVPPAWSDAILLSPRPEPDGESVLLGRRSCPSFPPPGGSYSSQLDVELPPDVSGRRFLHVVADSDTQVFEDVRGNNVGAARPSLLITPGPPPDLAVRGVDAPSEAYSGGEIEVAWTVVNAGEGRARPPWFDAVFLSLDARLEPASDILLGHAERTQAVEPGASYSQTARLRVPADLAGLCRLFVVADTTRRLTERGFLTNNLAGAITPVSVWRHPPSDLVVGTVQIPDGVIAGQQMAISVSGRRTGSTRDGGGCGEVLG